MMNTQLFNIEIKGYLRDADKKKLPNVSGVFFVYEASYIHAEDAVNLHRMIYVGNANNIRDGIIEHKKYEEWHNCICAGRELCYSFAEVEGEKRTRIAAAFTYKFKPLLNSTFKKCFPFGSTKILSREKTALLQKQFIVYENDSITHPAVFHSINQTMNTVEDKELNA